MRKTILSFLLLLGATAVRETTTEKSIWDKILAEQAQHQTYRGSRALYFNSYQEAVRLLKKAVRSNPNDPIAHRQLGVALYWIGAVEEAIEEYNKALKLDPHDVNTHQVLGIAYAWLGDIDKAQEEFETTLSLDSRRSDTHMNLGSIWDVKGNKEKSIHHLRKAILLEPENPLYHFQLGSIQVKYDNPRQAIKSFTRALHHAPSYEDVHVELGAAYDLIGETEKARSSFRKAIRLKPGDSVARLLLSSLYRKEGNSEKTEKMYRECLILTPGGDSNRLSLAVAFRGEKKDDVPSSPLEQFRKNLERIPDEQGARVTIEAIVEHQTRIINATRGVETGKKQPEITIRSFKQMIELEPASSRERKAHIDQFISSLKNKIDEIPQKENMRLNMDIQRDRNPAPRRKRKRQKNQKPKAVYQPRRIGNDAGLWIMGTAWMRLVKDLISRNLNEQTHDRLASIELGIGFLQIGQADKAITIFKDLIERFEDDVIAWNGLAVAYVELGETEEAITCYQHILTIEPKNRIARESIKWLDE